MDPFVKQVEKTIVEAGMLERGSAVLIGLSGGPDSVALVHCLRELSGPWRLRLFLAHLNHNFRGAESAADESWVREFAEQLGLPLTVKKLGDPPQSGRESFARAERYRFLAAAARQAGSSRVAVGHHRDDVVETFLINLLRGAGSSGLSGLAPMRGLAGEGAGLSLIRPLHRSSREEILSFLGRRGIEFCEDSSNADLRLLRNRIRHELVPLLSSYHPGLREALARNARVAGLESELVTAVGREFIERCCGRGPGRVEMSVAELERLLPSARMAALREALRDARGDLGGMGLVHLEAMERLVHSGPGRRSLDLPGALIRREGDRIEILASSSAGPAPRAGSEGGLPRELELEVPGEVWWPGPGGQALVLRAVEAGSASGAGSGSLPSAPGDAPGRVVHEARLALDSLALPLRVRGRAPGDRYQPAGMAGRRKVKKIMNELKLPVSARERWPLVVDGEGIVWIPGFRPSGRAVSERAARRVQLLVWAPAVKKG